MVEAACSTRGAASAPDEIERVLSALGRAALALGLSTEPEGLGFVVVGRGLLTPEDEPCGPLLAEAVAAECKRLASEPAAVAAETGCVGWAGASFFALACA